jgi:beta-galactosidase
MADPEAGAVVGRLMAKASASRGDVAKATSGNANLQKMMAGMRLDSMLKQVGDTINEEQVKQLNRVLQGIKKSKT